MSQSEKAAYFQGLKSAGVQFPKHYREYNTEELRAGYEKMGLPPITSFGAESDDGPGPSPAARAMSEVARAPRQAQADPNEMPGQRLNNSDELTPIRTDDQGRVWYQEEVSKPSFAKPRGRRVLKYMEGGVEQKTVQNGEYVETFEVAGTANRRESEVKITLPSYQVGIFKDRRFPFKIHTYNGRQGFDLFEVQNYYGGAELVPSELKRVYVENVLCYDVRTAVRAIQTEFRQLQLAGKVK